MKWCDTAADWLCQTKAAHGDWKVPQDEATTHSLWNDKTSHVSNQSTKELHVMPKDHIFTGMDFCFFRQSDTYLKGSLDTGLDTSNFDVEGTCAAIWTVPAASTVWNSRSSHLSAWANSGLGISWNALRRGTKGSCILAGCAVTAQATIGIWINAHSACDVTGSRGSLPWGRFRFLSTPRNAHAAQALHPSRALFITFVFLIANLKFKLPVRDV